ncbi:MAG: type II toxin-antitoxin system RelE/ParE family toxin [Betaproteobacteria bacterium]|nr:type II toxin-antitoxin system RelE/ParE family toxin [Betaproteobacteria bacterium]
MYTVVETPEFLVQASKIWTDVDREEFIDFIAAHPLAGDVIPQAAGVRKVRWAVSGRGKRGGARVIYFNELGDGLIVLLAVYIKAERSNLPNKAVRRIKREAEKH